jgi:PAS domain S-box-containing protein
MAIIIGVGVFIATQLALIMSVVHRQFEQRDRKLASQGIYLEQIIDNASDGIILIKPNGEIMVVNPVIEHLFGFSASELIGRNVSLLMSDDNASHHDGYLHDAKTLEPNILGRVRELNARRKDGSYFPIDLTVNSVDLPDGRYFMGTIRDISERKRAEEERDQLINELRFNKERMEEQAGQTVQLAEKLNFQSERLKYEINIKNIFFSIIAHDLKSPFNSLLGMTQMMSQMSDRFSKAKLVEYATDVNKAGNRVFELLNNLLEWSRLQMDGAIPVPTLIQLQELTQESIDILQPIALNKDIVLANEVGKTALFADRDMAGTVIRNLIANALKFTPSGGSVKVSSRKHGDMLQTTVADTGVGISEEQAEKIFDLGKKNFDRGHCGRKGYRPGPSTLQGSG